MAKKIGKPSTNGHATNGAVQVRRPQPATYRRRLEDGQRSQDPGATSPVTAPNMSRYFMPQIVTHQGRLSTIADVYRNPDEAMMNSIANARMMRKDLVIEECLEGRKLATALLGWHIEPEDDTEEGNFYATAVTKILKRIPNFTMYRFSIMDAIWQGRQANQHRYDIEKGPEGKRVIITGWLPIHGDKLAFRFDDGTGKHSGDDVGIRVGLNWNLKDTIAGGRAVEITEFGPAYFLEPWERRLLAIHKHIIEDGFFEEPISAGRIHGVGIRDRVYWTWLQKQEALAQLMEVVEKTGQGFYVYYFPAGNKQARDEMAKVAAEQSHSNYILMPRYPDEQPDQCAIDQIPPNTAGIEALRTIIHEFFGHQIKRYILGQTLTSEAQATGLGSNVADMHYESLMRIRDFDAQNLDETMTRETVETIKEYNWGAKARHVRLLYKTDTDSTESDKKLEAAHRAWDMGTKIKADDIYELCGLGRPDDDDEVLQNPAMQQQQRLWEQSHQEQQAAQAQGFDPATDGDTAGGNDPMNMEELFGPLAGGAEGDGAAPEPPGAAPYARSKKNAPAAGQRSLVWTDEDEAKHPRDEGGQWTSGQGAATKDDEAEGDFSLTRDPAIKSLSDEFENNLKGRQKALLSGLDAAPGQEDLFPDIDKQGDDEPSLDPPGYAERVQQLEAEGLTTSDAQGVADAEVMKHGKVQLEPPAQEVEPADVAADQATDETPRESADRFAETAKTDPNYVFARVSDVPNAGEDLLGSARHKVNAWTGLEQAEKQGNAAELVTRDTLLKLEPSSILPNVQPSNALQSLAAHYCLLAFPPSPEDPRLSRADPDSTPESRRQEYYDAYKELKTLADHLATSEPDTLQVLQKFHDRTHEIIMRLRGQKSKEYVHSVTAPRAYNPVANLLIDTLNRTKVGKFRPKKTDIISRINDFGQRFSNKYDLTQSELKADNPKALQAMENMAEHVRDVIEGDSLNKTFGTTGKAAERQIKPADLYVKKATRTGGRMIEAATVKTGTDFVMKNLKMRGLQWGNSVTDDERVHHLQFASEAFADLADVLGLPDSAMSLEGKLGLAIGARGKGNALAHYEPDMKVINLTRKDGVGTIAHEWGHFFDHHMAGGGTVLGKGGTSGGMTSGFATNKVGRSHEHVKDENGRWVQKEVEKGPIDKAFDAWHSALRESGFAVRLQQELNRWRREKDMSDGKVDYWSSKPEVFARTFERYVQFKLKQQGRENTYLSGFGTDTHWSGDKEHVPGSEFWPTDEEIAKIAPAFDALFKVYRENA